MKLLTARSAVSRLSRPHRLHRPLRHRLHHLRHQYRQCSSLYRYVCSFSPNLFGVSRWEWCVHLQGEVVMALVSPISVVRTLSSEWPGPPGLLKSGKLSWKCSVGRQPLRRPAPAQSGRLSGLSTVIPCHLPVWQSICSPDKLYLNRLIS